MTDNNDTGSDAADAADPAAAALREELRNARVAHDHAKAVYAAPQSSPDAAAAYYTARGRWYGIGRAIEVLQTVGGD